VRVALTDVVTTQDLRSHLDVEDLLESIDRLTSVVERLSERLDSVESSQR
jgi:ubiquinone biosynthesis protein UbiJ